MQKMGWSELAGVHISVKARVAEGRASRVSVPTLGRLRQYLAIAQRLGCHVCFESASTMTIYPRGAE